MNAVINLPESGLAVARHEVVTSAASAYGAMRRYASALNATFPFAWYEVAHGDKGDEAKLVHGEKSELFKELKAADHSNPSTIWKRVRDYGKEEREGKPEGEDEGEGNANPPVRSAMVRNCEELLALYKYNARQEDLPQKVKQAQSFIEKALNALGVDLSNI